MSEQLAFTVNMYQSSTRKNFLDILADPTAIAILGSIALHAIIGTTLPFFTQPEKEGKKAGPTTVKVVQLTPNELQRIPQAPPTPVPQSPVTKPAPTARPSVAPTTPQFSTAPQTIPFSPVRTPNTSKPPSGQKEQKKSTSAIFDPDAVFKPTPTPTKPPTKKGDPPKKTVAQQSPPPKTQPQPKKTTAPTPQPIPSTDDDGTDPSTTKPTTTPNTQTKQPPSSQQTTPESKPNSTTQPTTQPSGDSAGNGGNGFYGRYTDAAIKQLTLYMQQYGVKDPYPPKTLTLRYPQGMLCIKQQAPLIVLMAVFDKVPDNKEEAILGTSSAPSLDIKVFKDRDTPELKQLGELAARAAIEETNKADQSRPEKDKGKRVIHQYIVKFDPTTCKN
jgi:hypothetical protein